LPVFDLGKTDFANQLQFDAARGLNGDWWGGIPFLFLPANLDRIWAAFALYFFWMMGTALEANWGTGRYNLFLWVGALLNLASAFIPLALGLPGGQAGNWALLSSVFFAFATLYPDFVIYLFFILPVRIKWIALISAVFLLFGFLVAGWSQKAMIAASFGNYLVFFAPDIVQRIRFGGKQMARQARRLGAMGPDPAVQAMHTCAICRRTEKSHPALEFRYCSQCGNRCYCLEHLPNHPCTPSPTA